MIIAFLASVRPRNEHPDVVSAIVSIPQHLGCLLDSINSKWIVKGNSRCVTLDDKVGACK